MAQIKIFFSYSWKDREAADEIFTDLRKFGYRLTRDVFEVKFTQEWIEFMDGVREHDFVLALISENYFKSVGCMYEALQFRQAKKADGFEQRFIPVALDHHLFSKSSPDAYNDYWKEEIKNMRIRVAEIGAAASPRIQKELELAEQIKMEMPEMISFLRAIKIDDHQTIKDNAYVEIIRKISPGDGQLELIEKKLYDTLISDEIANLNHERAEILGKKNAPSDIPLLIERRFKLGVREVVRDKLREFTQRADLADQEIIRQLKEYGAWPEEHLLQAFYDTSDKLAARLMGHCICEKWQKRPDTALDSVRQALERPDLPYFKLEAVAELADLANDRSLSEPIEQWLRQQLYRVVGKEQTEVWALLCETLKRLDNNRYQHLFALAHYVFLKKRSNETEPFKFPLLLNIQGFRPGKETYVQLLDGDDDEKMAAVWVLSYFGGIYIFLCNKNNKPLDLPQQSRDALLNLSKKDLDYKDKWRLCCAAASTHLLELIPWLKRQAKEPDMLENTVSINHGQYGLIEEPEAAMAIRACGYFALLSKERSDLAAYEDLKAFLSDEYANRKPEENPDIELSLATALGYLGDARPLLRLVKLRQEEWVHEAAANAVLMRTNREEKAACYKWIHEKIGAGNKSIESHPDLSKKAKKTYAAILEQLEDRLGY